MKKNSKLRIPKEFLIVNWYSWSYINRTLLEDLFNTLNVAPLIALKLDLKLQGYSILTRLRRVSYENTI